MINNYSREISNILLEKYINPTIEQYNYILKKDYSEDDMLLFFMIVHMLVGYSYRNQTCIDFIEKGYSISFDKKYDFSAENNFLKQTINLLRNEFENRYNSIDKNAYDRLSNKSLNYISNYEFDYEKFYFDNSKDKIDDSIMKYIIAFLKSDISNNVYQRINRFLYPYSLDW